MSAEAAAALEVFDRSGLRVALAAETKAAAVEPQRERHARNQAIEFLLMIKQWIVSGWSEAPMVVLSTVVTYAAILVYTRLVGLRSFSKMSAADFAMTVAVGSLFASTISSPSPSLVIGLASLAMLYLGQYLVAVLRVRAPATTKVIENQPLLLMHGGEILDANLRRANLTRQDLYGKLREANAINIDQVLAVVFEATGDVSVLHSADPAARLDPRIFAGVADAERLSV